MSEQINIEGIPLGVDEKHGALVIYCPKHYRGVNICLQWETLWTDRPQIWANVVERIVNDIPQYIAVFPRLEPRKYHVWSNARQANITVFAGHIAEIDWR